MAADSSIQRITRLTPLSAILALIESRVVAVAPQKSAIAAALGRTLVEDVVAAQLPPMTIALRDGFAVEAGAIADAGPYSPVPFASKPQRVEVGEPLPSGTDAVVPFDAVSDRDEAIAAVSPGEGVLATGGDCTPRTPLRRTGERVRAIDIAVIAAAGIAEVTVRSPRILIACDSTMKTPLIESALDGLAHAATVAGCAVLEAQREGRGLDRALADESADAVIALGGTGSGRRDAAVHALARLGQVEAHGIAVSPGETAAFGFASARPVLLVPGRLDAALAVWLLVGRHLVAKLAGGGITDLPVMLPLKRKVTSNIGLTELVPVSCAGGVAEPLASGYLSLESLARSDGWIVVPAESEGFAAGTPVAVRAWP
ncbi:MAG TPA: molybdopterin-binding protein [Xanthobacteraceae bacterium]|nr:molybdopterin-binding protein [Xanthobacteraceae bacterium]